MGTSRRSFIKEGAAIGVGATALARVKAEEANAQARVAGTGKLML